MFGTIRKHQTWLWAIIITLTIISFVIFFSPYSKLNTDRRGNYNFGRINGQKITEEQFVSARNEAYLHYFFMSGGQWPDENTRRMGFDVERETYQWLLLLQKADDMGLHVSLGEAGEVAKDMLAGFQRAGINSSQTFVKQVLEPRGLSLTDFQRFVQHYLAIQEVVSLTGLSGHLITPQEARDIYIRNHQEVAADAAFFNASNYLAAVTVTPEAINSWYTNRQAEYRLPERVQVKYVEFGISNLLGQAEAELAKTNLNEIISANLERLGTNYTRFGNTPEEAKAKIREEVIRSKALSEARKSAAEFASVLFDKQPVSPENLDALAKTKGLEVKTTAPFDRQGTPAGLDVGADFTKAAFSRTPDDPFAPPIIGRDGVYVIAMYRRLPSEVPSLDSIRAKVESDYKLMQATTLARQAGQTASVTISNAVAQGKSFADACREAKVEPVPLAPFSISSRSIPELPRDVSADEVKQLAFSTDPGKVSKFEDTRAGGMVLYLKQKLPINEEKLKSDLPAYVTQLRQTRVNEAFNDWFRKEAIVGLRDTPIGQPRQPPPTMSGAQKKS